MFRYLISSLFCLLLTLNGSSQEIKGRFYVTGKAKVEQGVVDGTTIEIFRNGGLLSNVSVNRTGNFRIAIDLGCLYRFQFVKEGYYSKSVEFDTHVPTDVSSDNSQFPPYQMAVMLYKKVPGVSVVGAEIARVSYNSKIDNFDAELLRNASSEQDNADKIINEIKQKSIEYEKQTTKIKQDNYRTAINDADELARHSNWEKAMGRYRDAVLIDPTQINPRNKVNSMYQLLVEQQLVDKLGAINEQNYLKYLNYAQKQYEANEFSVAFVAYRMALKVRPDDEQLKQRLNNAQRDVAKLQELALTEIEHDKLVYKARTDKYTSFTKQGDAKFRQKELADAKDYYAQAATQIKENSYAVLMIQRIDELTGDSELALRLAKEREAAEKLRLSQARNRAYNDAIAEADRLLEQRLYRDAIEAYELALTIKSYEFYPKNQIRIIKEILANLQIKGGEYNRLLREADVLMQQKEYSDARPIYVEAHAMISDEEYAQKRIFEIDRLLKNVEKDSKIDFKYSLVLVDADRLLNQKKYNEAIAKYQEAQIIKSDETYPKEQIIKIRAILAKENSEQALKVQRQSDYDRSITMADEAFNQENYQTARTLYLEALQVFSGQEYPQNQIRKIDELLRKRSLENKAASKLEQIDFSNLQHVDEADRRAAYLEAMTLGESFIKTEEWGIARFYFRRALALLPNDQLATNKLNEVEKQIVGDNINEAKYNEMIKKADESFKTGDFGVAKFYYTKAREANPTDDYVNERIQVVTRLTESTAARESNREYDTAMKKASEAFAAKNYAVARFFYRKAISIKSNDELAKQKLAEVESLINK